MQPKTYHLLLLAAILLLISTAPAIALDSTIFTQKIGYRVGGRIDIDRRLGDPCTTGAVKDQRIHGYGDLTRQEDVKIAFGIITTDEKTDWTVPFDAAGNLAVTTMIDLCSRAMSRALEDYTEDDYDIRSGDLIHTYHPLVVSGELAVEPFTEQYWRTHQVTNPGAEGSYHADFIAAYGPGPYEAEGVLGEAGLITYYEERFRWWFEYAEDDEDKMFPLGIGYGDNYVGNYFEIDQYAYVSSGELKREISLSSPWSGAFLEEALSLEDGMARITDRLVLDNLEAGPEGLRFAWYELLFR